MRVRVCACVCEPICAYMLMLVYVHVCCRDVLPKNSIIHRARMRERERYRESERMRGGRMVTETETGRKKMFAV